MANLLVDSKARPVPQILKDDETTYIDWKGENGAGFVAIPNGYDATLGNTADTSAASTVNGNLLKVLEAVEDADPSTALVTLVADIASIKADLVTVKANIATIKANTDAMKAETLVTPLYSRPSIFTSAARTGSGVTGPIDPKGRDFGIFFVDVTALDAGATITITVETKDGESDEWFQVVTDPASIVLNSISKISFFVVRGLGYNYRVCYAITGGNVTFSVGAIIK